MKKLIVANWKLNPGNLAEAVRLVRSLAPAARSSKAEVVFCPPAAYLASLRYEFPRLKFGAQNSDKVDTGPFTGAMGPSVLKSAGASYVIAGHSERRSDFGETDADIAEKVVMILEAKLTPILCIGEPLAVREKGIAASQAFVADQIRKDFKNISKVSAAKVIIAYEPVWAISTSASGKSETAEDAAAMIRFIRKIVKNKMNGVNAQVLYGGSVNARNAGDFLEYDDISGLLVGGASLKPKDFSEILRHA